MINFPDRYALFAVVINALTKVTQDGILDEEAQHQATKKQIFGPKQATSLSELLTSCILPSVSSTEQMYLLALIDTYKHMQDTQGALDERGVRFLLATKMFSFMRRSLQGKYQPVSVQPSDYIWALHSDSQETLVQSCLASDADWAAAKSLGVGLWITNPTILRALVERIAKVHFMMKKDPADSALFYLALKKRGALAVLYKSTKDQKIVDFLNNDFTDPKNITSAAKNAYRLQSLHRCVTF
jgi:hypothetical protein